MKDITGQRFNKLVAIKYLGKRTWLWRCDCGNEKPMLHQPIKAGLVKSCGCSANDHKTIHGFSSRKSRPKEYNVWSAMRQRCNIKTHKSYHAYGGRGITICERWNDFANFYADMGVCPDGHSIDRIDNNGNYEPSNCRWATVEQQTHNRRPFSEWKPRSYLATIKETAPSR